MRKDFGAKPYTYPQPVFIVATYDEAGVADAMNAAWGGISNDTQITMCLSAGHKTVKNILEKNSLEYKLQNPTHELLKQTIEDLISNNNIDLEQYKHKVKDNLKMQLKLQRKDKLENLLYKLNSDNVQEISIELINFMNESNKSISEANKK